MKKIKVRNIFDIKFNKEKPFIHISKENLYRIIFQCIIIGFLGFILETCVTLINLNILVDRGFLFGPFIPLYSFFLFAYLLFFKIPEKNFKNFFVYFILLAISITIIEFCIGNLCEIIFNAKLWSYEGIKYSYKYISLPVSILWGLLSTIYIMFIVPLIYKLSLLINFKFLQKIIKIFLIILSIDMIASLISIIKEGKYDEKYYFTEGFSVFLFLSGLFFYGILIYLFANFIINQFKIKKKIFAFIFYPLYYFSLLFPILAMYDYLFKVKNEIFAKFAIVGFFVLAIYIYFSILFLPLIGIKKIFIKPKNIKNNNRIIYILLLISILSSSLICIEGIYQVKNQIITTYNIKYNSIKQNYKIVAISDIHFGGTGSIVNLNKMVKNINSLNPDLIFFVGDIIDNKIDTLDEIYFIDTISKLNSTFGSFAIVGNHDIQFNNAIEIKSLFAVSKIDLINDSLRIINDDLCIIGRKDYSENRKTFEEINHKNNQNIIILDHQPQDAFNINNKNVIMQISGHTHQGQLFPFNLILSSFYKINFNTVIYGKMKFNDSILIVSRGYGNWGFPIRTTGHSEIVVINLEK